MLGWEGFGVGGGEGSSEKWRLQFGDFKGLHGI